MIFHRQSKSGNLSTTLIISGVLLVIGVTFLIFIFPNMIRPATNIYIGDGIFRTKLALDENARTKGLSGVKQIDADEALLMAFPSEGKWSIWMKDMLFPIDIVWLNKDKKVIYIVKNASPEDSISLSHEPTSPAKYVVELPAGTVDNKAISVKSLAIFQINSEDIK